MKILMIYGNPYHSDYGGVNIHTKYLIKHLSKNEQIEIIQLTFDEISKVQQTESGKLYSLKRIPFASIFFPIQLVIDIYRLQKKIDQIKPDVIHLQSTVPTFSVLGSKIEKKIPTIITLHGYLAEEYRLYAGIKKIFYQFICAPLEKKALSTIPYIISVSPQMKDRIQPLTHSTIHVIPNGIDLNHIKKIQPEPASGQQTVFYLGMLTKGKGVSDLIEAIAIIKKKIKNVHLFIGGNGPYESQLKKIVKDLHLDQSVTFLGFLDEYQKYAYMKSIDVFVLPSYWESFPMVILEAMGCGKPIISTNISGIPYAVTDQINGYLIKPGDIEALAEKIMVLLTNDELKQKMGEENLQKAKQFDWNEIAKKTVQIYQKIK